MSFRTAALTAWCVLCGSRSAYAAPPEARPLALDVEAQVGWVEGDQSGGVDLGATARIRYSVLTAGISLQGATSIFGGLGIVSGVGGLSLPIGFIRFDALGEFGFNAYTGVRSNFWTHDPGAHATLPFAGGRASLLARVFQNNRGRIVWLGPSIQYAKDLYSTTRTYTFRDQGEDWLNGGSYDRLGTSTVRVGQTRISILATIAVTIPL
jgi:hypothetical protein